MMPRRLVGAVTRLASIGSSFALNRIPRLGRAGRLVDSGLSDDGTTISVARANAPFQPAAVSGTPAQHALFQENVVKGWINLNGTGTPAINDSFNVTSITDNGVGDYTITWDRDFATANYALAGACQKETAGAETFVTINDTGSLAAGSARILVADDAGTVRDVTPVCVIAIGDQ